MVEQNKQKRSLDHLNFTLLVVTLDYSFARCYHWRKLGKRYTVLFTSTRESIVTSIEILIKTIFKVQQQNL